jgi:hypothetical protein
VGVTYEERSGFLYILLALFLTLGMVAGSAQESYIPKGSELNNRSVITVKGNELNNGVVVVDILKTGKPYELQCNQGASSSTALKSGKYQIVELPKNFGMYDCKVVEVCSEFAADPEKEKKLGEYCLIEK